MGRGAQRKRKQINRGSTRTNQPVGAIAWERLVHDAGGVKAKVKKSGTPEASTTKRRLPRRRVLIPSTRETPRTTAQTAKKEQSRDGRRNVVDGRGKCSATFPPRPAVGSKKKRERHGQAGVASKKSFIEKESIARGTAPDAKRSFVDSTFCPSSHTEVA